MNFVHIYNNHFVFYHWSISQCTCLLATFIKFRNADNASQVTRWQFRYFYMYISVCVCMHACVHNIALCSCTYTIVAANITELFNSNTEKLTFPLVSEDLSWLQFQSSVRDQSAEKPDEKKLIGYAQLSIIGSSMGSTVQQQLSTCII